MNTMIVACYSRSITLCVQKRHVPHGIGSRVWEPAPSRPRYRSPWRSSSWPRQQIFSRGRHHATRVVLTHGRHHCTITITKPRTLPEQWSSRCMQSHKPTRKWELSHEIIGQSAHQLHVGDTWLSSRWPSPRRYSFTTVSYYGGPFANTVDEFEMKCQ